MTTKARDFHKPGYAGFQFSYAEQAVSLSGLPLTAIRETYRTLAAKANAGNNKAAAYLPLVVEVGLGLAMAAEADVRYGHDRVCVCSAYDRCRQARLADARSAGTHNGAIRAMHRAYND